MQRTVDEAPSSLAPGNAATLDHHACPPHNHVASHQAVPAKLMDNISWRDDAAATKKVNDFVGLHQIQPCTPKYGCIRPESKQIVGER